MNFVWNGRNAVAGRPRCVDSAATDPRPHSPVNRYDVNRY